MYFAIHLVTESSDHYTFCLHTDFTQESLDNMKSTLECDIISSYYWSSFSPLTEEQNEIIKNLLYEVYKNSIDYS